MDLNQAIATARRGGKVRDDANMRPDWAIMFFPDPGQDRVDPDERAGLFHYVDPRGEKAHRIQFNDAHRSSSQWRTVP